jgi:hypothetical protein
MLRKVVTVLHPILKAKDGRILPPELFDPRLVILPKGRYPLLSVLGGGGGSLVVMEYDLLALEVLSCAAVLLQEVVAAALDVAVEVGVQGLPALHDGRHGVRDTGGIYASLAPVFLLRVPWGLRRAELGGGPELGTRGRRIWGDGVQVGSQTRRGIFSAVRVAVYDNHTLCGVGAWAIRGRRCCFLIGCWG